MVDIISHWKEEQKRRIEEQEKIYHYYVGNETEIISYLEKAQSLTFSSDDITEFQKMWINITKKIINQLAIVYRNPATRYLVTDGKENETETEKYLELIPKNINTVDKMALRYAKAFNTSLTYCYFDKEKELIKYKVLPSYLYNVETEEDDFYKIKKLSYSKYFYVNGKPELFEVVWTDKEHYKQQVLTIAGNKVTADKTPIGDNVEMINPYGKVPYATLRLEEQNDFWGSGMNDLVNTNEQINFLLSDLINAGVIMQSWGTPLAINCGLANKSNGQSTLSKVRVGAKHPLVVENVSSDMVTPSLEFKSANPLISEVKDTIDWLIKTIAITKGLDPNKFLSEVSATSGFSKIMDSLEQLELRIDDIEPCRIYEEERFEITNRILEVESKPFTGELVCDFAEISQTQTADEKQKENDYKLKHNLISVLDLARESNPDLDDEQLEEMLTKNKLINEKFKTGEVKTEPIKPVLEKTENL